MSNKIKFENYKSCLKAAQLENKINYLEKNRTEINSIKEFMENNKTMLKIQQRFKSKKRKMLIVFDDMIVDKLSNKKINPIVAELFIRGRKHLSCFYYPILFCYAKRY